MTEIPEHLLRRAREARIKAAKMNSASGTSKASPEEVAFLRELLEATYSGEVQWSAGQYATWRGFDIYCSINPSRGDTHQYVQLRNKDGELYIYDPLASTLHDYIWPKMQEDEREKERRIRQSFIDKQITPTLHRPMTAHRNEPVFETYSPQEYKEVIKRYAAEKYGASRYPPKQEVTPTVSPPQPRPSRRHSRIFRLQRAFFGGLVGITAVITLALGAGQTIHNHNAKNAVDNFENRDHFYLVIAGQDDPRSSRAGDQLAGDLHAIASDPAAVGSFIAPNSKYSGITEEIGFNPFVGGDRCDECGSLTPFMRGQIDTITKGGVQSVLAPPAAKNPEGGLTLTPFGMPVWEAFLLGYNVFGLAALGAAVQADKKTHSYDDDTWLDWRLTEPGRQSKLNSLILCPSLALTYRRCGKRHLKELRDNNVLGPLEALHSMQEEIRELPAGAREDEKIQGMDAELSKLIGQLEGAPGHRVESRQRTVYKQQAELLASRFDDIKKQLDALQQAEDEVDDL